MQNFKESLFIARTTSKEAIKRDGRGKYYLFFLMDLIYCFNILLTPFHVSKWEIANEIRKGNKISITNGYNSIYGKGYGSLLQANIIKRVIFFSLMLVILIFGAVLFLVGYGVYYLSNSNNFIAVFFWLIPAALLLIMALVIYPYIHVSNAYIFNRYPNISPSKVLKLSFYSLRNNGKRRLFAINMLEFGAKFGILLPFIIIGVIVSVANSNLFITIGIFSLMGALALVFSFIFYPRISLIALIMRANLFDEIVVMTNSNKFNATFDFDIDYDGDNKKALNKIFDIEETKDEESSSYQKHLDELAEEDKKKRKKEKRANKAIEDDLNYEEANNESAEDTVSEENNTDTEPENISATEEDNKDSISDEKEETEIEANEALEQVETTDEPEIEEKDVEEVSDSLEAQEDIEPETEEQTDNSENTEPDDVEENKEEEPSFKTLKSLDEINDKEE